jgi:hypothetical protein
MGSSTRRKRVGKKDLIHERGMSVKILELEGDRILIEGTLTDERFCESFIYLLERLVDPGVIHHVIVRIILSLPKLLIESAEAEMPAVPVDMCKEMKDSVKKLVGLQLTRGFKSKLKERLGGKNGCLHMTNLILFMNTAALQGSYTFYNRVREDGRLKDPKFDNSPIVNSCHVWREEGPYAPRFEDMGKARRSCSSHKK